MNRSAAVAPSKPPATAAARAGCSSQWRNTNGITTRIAAGRLLILSGHGVIRLRVLRARRLHLKGRADGKGPNAGVVEKNR